MLRGRASLTAYVVALAREARRLPPRARAVVGALSFGVVEHVLLRTQAIDAVLAREVSRGVSQVVLLGAGLDRRAYRLDVLSDAIVFEVDWPATQVRKRARAGGWTSLARDVVYCGVDFERDAVEVQLAHAGHDARLETVFVWEGVTPYLTPAAIRGTLRAVGEAAAKGSVLAMTYATPELSTAAALLHPLVRPAFALAGEPLRGLSAAKDVHAWVEGAGFTLEEDTGAADWAARASAPVPWNVLSERLLVARRR